MLLFLIFKLMTFFVILTTLFLSIIIIWHICLRCSEKYSGHYSPENIKMLPLVGHIFSIEKNASNYARQMIKAGELAQQAGYETFILWPTLDARVFIIRI